MKSVKLEGIIAFGWKIVWLAWNWVSSGVWEDYTLGITCVSVRTSWKTCVGCTYVSKNRKKEENVLKRR